MGQPYIGEIRLVGFNFQPVGWNFCNGALLAISEFDALFNLIGTTYGGDGQQTFALPDLQGRVPVHMGSSGASNYVIGELGGAETVTLNTNQMPSHSHMIRASSSVGTESSPINHYPAMAPLALGYTYLTSQAGTMAANNVASGGGSQPHDNIQPSLVMNYIISLFGVFPTQ